MGIVGAFLAIEVRFRIAAAALRRRLARAVLGLTLFIEAQASISVPSTEK